MEIEKLLHHVPWITGDGFVDLAKYPIEGVLTQALSEDDQESRSAFCILRSMHLCGREEAGVYLLGLLKTCGNRWDKRIAIVEAMEGFDTKPCADLLLAEFKRIKSSNTTRRYLGDVIKVLSRMPPELVEDGLESLANDRSLSVKLREKFRVVLEARSFDEDYS
jgi:hypothetical protein